MGKLEELKFLELGLRINSIDLGCGFSLIAINGAMCPARLFGQQIRVYGHQQPTAFVGTVYVATKIELNRNIVWLRNEEEDRRSAIFEFMVIGLISICASLVVVRLVRS